MDRRRNGRVSVQLPVQVWGLDAYGQAFTSPAMIANISAGGLVLQGLNRHLRVGELLDIRMGEETAQFRIVWIGASPTQKAGEIGMQRVTVRSFVPDWILAHCSQVEINA